MNELELVVNKSQLGILETNIEELEKFVDGKLTEYNPENYFGDADMAKKDRTELNNSKKFLTQSRIKIVKELWKPYEDFETRCKNLEKKIDTASGKLDEIVKEKEFAEKEAKRILCVETWKLKNFDLFPVEKVFNQKWLNKSMKKKDISDEMDAIIAKTYQDLKTIERFAEDAETLKAMYLEDLNIDEVFGRADELQKNRERIQREKEERERREKESAIQEQKAEERKEEIQIEKSDEVEDIVAEALNEKVEEEKSEYVFTLEATEKEILRIKKLLSDNGIVYTSCNKLEF
ncbi:MAG: DUF1351 domain-containing protein [Fibrobacter sp.]|nr:DUF1351 domain-containing protein [Fibrobacter sp.]